MIGSNLWQSEDCVYPCPCGYFGDPVKACTCSPTQIARYQGRLSGPLLDRIDIHVDVPRVDYDKLMGDQRAETSAAIRARVESARERQRERFTHRDGGFTNADMGVSEIQQYCELTPDAKRLIELSTKRLQLSARAYHRVLKLSRTIADLAETQHIEAQHVAEAIQYRPRQTQM